MKKIILISILFLCYATSFSQVPEKFNYQAVIRDASGNIRSEVNVAIQILILQGSVTSNPIYIENHNVRTSAFGLVNLALGSGTVDLGTFSKIDWAIGPYFIKVKINGVDYGSSDVLSVPYALYANRAGNGFSGNYNDLANLPLLFDGTWSSLTGKPAFATVATSGSYNDLLNKPSLFSGSYNDLTNKPVLFDGTWISLTGKPTTLSGYGIADAMNISHAANNITTTNITNWNAAFGWGNHSGLYRPITYVPTWDEVTGKPAFAAVATSGTFYDLLERPSTANGYGITDVVTIKDDQTIQGIKTFTKDILINGLTIGSGKGADSSNAAIGYQVLNSNTTGSHNTAYGINALYSNTTGYSNAAFGAYALYNNQFGSNLVAIGDSALYNNIGRTNNDPRYGYTYGVSNTAVGSKSLFSNTDGNYNTASGYQALYSNSTGNGNTASGYQALYSNITGEGNIANGYQTLYSNTDGNYNTASGYLALYSNITGYDNTASGYQALYSNTTGHDNTAYGIWSLRQNTTGSYNTALGYGTLYSNTTGSYNIAIGLSPLGSNTSGDFNIAIGYRALLENTIGRGNVVIGGEGLDSNTTGNHNTATGSVAMQWNTTGNDNTAYGFFSLRHNTTGNDNTAVGDSTGLNNSTGSYNTFIGSNANISTSNLSNATAVGSYALVNASNKVRIGNSNVTVIEGQVNWSVGSDSRLKDNILYTDKLGLDFIKELKTATFTYKNDLTRRPHDGLVAQDVKKVLQQLGINFSGLIESDNDEKTLNLAYAEFVIPLINAVQEQQNQIEAQQKQIDELKKIVGILGQK